VRVQGAIYSARMWGSPLTSRFSERGTQLKEAQNGPSDESPKVVGKARRAFPRRRGRRRRGGGSQANRGAAPLITPPVSRDKRMGKARRASPYLSTGLAACSGPPTFFRDMKDRTGAGAITLPRLRLRACVGARDAEVDQLLRMKEALEITVPLALEDDQFYQRLSACLLCNGGRTRRSSPRTARPCPCRHG
jgi:hypothetical protein